jgi:hypothetical protein
MTTKAMARLRLFAAFKVRYDHRTAPAIPSAQKFIHFLNAIERAVPGLTVIHDPGHLRQP